jgi:hypothetical protein
MLPNNSKAVSVAAEPGVGVMRHGAPKVFAMAIICIPQLAHHGIPLLCKRFLVAVGVRIIRWSMAWWAVT